MARACAEAGAKAIALFDANQDLGDTSAAELHAKTGLPVTFYKVDVRDGGAINAAVQSVAKTYGTPDVLINSAGIADSNLPAENYDAAMFRRLVDINLTGSFLMSQAVGRAAIAAGKPASIVLVASMSGSIVNYPQEQSCYNASKAGVIQLGRSLAAEWAKYNIRVNCSKHHFFSFHTPFMLRIAPEQSLWAPQRVTNMLQSPPVTWTPPSTRCQPSTHRRRSGRASPLRHVLAMSTSSTAFASSSPPMPPAS